MSALNERSITSMLFNPWAVYIADVGDAQPAIPSFYTERGIGVNPQTEFVDAEAYNVCSGVSYVVRKDVIRFKLIVNYLIKNFTVNVNQLVYGGTITSTALSSTLTYDGVAPPYKAMWLETCFSDNNKIVRLHIPKGRSIDTAAFESGDAHINIPTTFEALPEIDDANLLPTLFFEH